MVASPTTYFGMVSIVFVVAIAAACGDGGDVIAPKPAPPRAYRETDDWVKPGTKKILKGGIAEASDGRTFRLVNSDNFTWNLLDDIWLLVKAPIVEVNPNGPYIGDGRHGWYVYLRCPTPRVIPPGGDAEISLDECHPTTYEPGPGARVTGYRIVAKEGAKGAGMEGGFPLVRTKSQARQGK